MASFLFDPVSAMETLGLEGLVFQQVLASSIREINQRLESARKIQEIGDPSRLVLEAHTMKSTAAGIGAFSCRDLAFDLEKAARSGDPAAARGVLVRLGAEFDRLRTRVDRYVSEQRPGLPIGRQGPKGGTF